MGIGKLQFCLVNSVVSGSLISKYFKNAETVIKKHARLFLGFLGFLGFNGREGVEDRPDQHPQPWESQIELGQIH